MSTERHLLILGITLSINRTGIWTMPNREFLGNLETGMCRCDSHVHAQAAISAQSILNGSKIETVRLLESKGKSIPELSGKIGINEKLCIDGMRSTIQAIKENRNT